MKPGEDVDFTVPVTNLGQGPGDATVEDATPAGPSFVSNKAGARPHSRARSGLWV